MFSKEAQDKFAKDEAATKAKADQEAAQSALHQAQLEVAVSETEAKTQAEKLKGIMAEISTDTSDHEKLQQLSENAQETKGALLAATAKEKAAREKLAENQQEMVKYTATATADEEKAAEEEKKANDEEEAEQAAEEAPDPTGMSDPVTRR